MDEPCEPIDTQALERLFAHLERGDSDAFFAHVADDVAWTVMGTHPLAGAYHDKRTFRAATFERLDRLVRGGIRLRLVDVLVQPPRAAVELVAEATASNGRPFDNRYCWVLRFDGGRIVEVRAYLDSALVQQLVDENEPVAR